MIVNAYHMLSNVEKEKLVIDLYYNQRKNVRQIAQEVRISFRDIAAILKKQEAAVNDGSGTGNGIVIVDNQQRQQSNDSNNNTKAYKLYTEGNKPVEVAIQLGLSEKEATRYYTEYWRLTHLYNLHSIYKELKGDLSPILKLYRLLKREGITTDKIEWFVHTVNTGMYKIPEIQKQYAKIKDELEAIDYKKTMAKHQLDDMNNQITYLNKISYSKRNEIAYLQIGVQELEGYVHGLENHNQQQQQQQEIQNE
jgi:predicted transcriptional regulator